MDGRPRNTDHRPQTTVSISGRSSVVCRPWSVTRRLPSIRGEKRVIISVFTLVGLLAGNKDYSGRPEDIPIKCNLLQ
jgi:hypothetical protein